MQTTKAHTDMDMLLNRVAQLLDERYVVPQIGARGAYMLRVAVNEQRYQHISTMPDQLAALVTADLRQATGDGHLYLEYLPDDRPPEDDWIARWQAAGPTHNWGVQDIRLLPGNVGYVRLSSFYPYDLARPALHAAMELVQHTAGLVLDLTNNGGGDDTTANAVMMSFFDAHVPPPLLTETRTEHAQPIPVPELVWPRYGSQRPLVILINQRTFSAPEAVAYALQHERRAVVMGTRSGGGANMIDEAIPVAACFRVGIPTRRPISRTTNTNWEGVGVIPDVVAPSESALWFGWERVRHTLNHEAGVA